MNASAHGLGARVYRAGLLLHHAYRMARVLGISDLVSVRAGWVAERAAGRS